jgi:hypothetical protein
MKSQIIKTIIIYIRTCKLYNVNSVHYVATAVRYFRMCSSQCHLSNNGPEGWCYALCLWHYHLIFYAKFGLGREIRICFINNFLLNFTVDCPDIRNTPYQLVSFFAKLIYSIILTLTQYDSKKCMINNEVWDIFFFKDWFSWFTIIYDISFYKEPNIKVLTWNFLLCVYLCWRYIHRILFHVFVYSCGRFAPQHRYLANTAFPFPADYFW